LEKALIFPNHPLDTKPNRTL